MTARLPTPAAKRPAVLGKPWQRVVVALFSLYLLVTFVVMTLGGRFNTTKNILLLGVDQRTGDVGRSDSIMLLNVNSVTRKARVLSIPRDTRVQIPGRGTGKINAAYAYGGPSDSCKAVEDLLGLTVNGYVVVNFDAFARLVDAIGGVKIEVEKPMRYDDPYQDLYINLDAGIQTLQGKEALDFVRFRSDPEGDIARARRQQAFLAAMLKKMASPVSWVTWPSAMGVFKDAATTNIPLWRSAFVAVALTQSAAMGVQTRTLGGRPAMQGGASYWVAEESDVNEVLMDFFNMR